MKKDLQKLREAVALKEREKIIGIKTPAFGRTSLGQKPEERNLNQNQVLENTKIFQKKNQEEKEAITEMKNYAQESEKQQILYLEEQKKVLGMTIEVLEKQKEPPLLLQKNQLVIAREEIRKKLEKPLEEVKRKEDEEKMLGEIEQRTALPADKQKLEKKRQAVEKEREVLERSEWATEKELETIENQLKIADEACRKVVEEKNGLKNKLAEVENSLRSVYAGIMNREKERISLEKGKKDAESLKQAAITSKRKEGIMEKEWSGREGVSGLEFLKKLPDDAKKERLKKIIQNTTNDEEDQRKKFLENVEKWSEEKKGKDPNDINNIPGITKLDPPPQLKK